MTAQSNIPYLTTEFINRGKHYRRTSQFEALVSTSSPYSTMELSIYKYLYPKEYETDDESEHDYSTILNPHKNYSICSFKHITSNYYLTNESRKIPITSKFYIIKDTNEHPPDIILGTDTLFDPTIFDSITSEGMHLSDINKTLIHYSYIIKTPNPSLSLIYNQLSPQKAKVRSSPTSPFHHQGYRIQTTDENRDQRSPNHLNTSGTFTVGQPNLK